MMENEVNDEFTEHKSSKSDTKGANREGFHSNDICLAEEDSRKQKDLSNAKNWEPKTKNGGAKTAISQC